MPKLTMQDLAQIKDQAMRSESVVLNPYWKRAYIALADAADRLHAMMRRTVVEENSKMEKICPHCGAGPKEEGQPSVEGEPSYVHFEKPKGGFKDEGETIQ